MHTESLGKSLEFGDSPPSNGSNGVLLYPLHRSKPPHYLPVLQFCDSSIGIERTKPRNASHGCMIGPPLTSNLEGCVTNVGWPPSSQLVACHSGASVCVGRLERTPESLIIVEKGVNLPRSAMTG